MRTKTFYPAICLEKGRQKNARMITIDLERYPFFQELQDPEGMIRMILDKEYAIFKAQYTNSSNVELLKIVSDTCETLTHNFSAMEEEQSQTINKVLSQIPILLAKSTTKGSIAEKCLLDYMKENLCTNEYTFEDTSKRSNSGDIVIRKKEFACMIDSKHYKTNVPRKEVEKLKRDMSIQDVRNGILVNFSNGIVGCKNIDMEFFEEDGKMYCLAMLGNVSENPLKIIMTLHYLESLCKRYEPTTRIVERSVDEYEDILEMTENLSMLIGQFEKHKSVITKSVEEYYKSLCITITSYVKELGYRLKKKNGSQKEPS